MTPQERNVMELALEALNSVAPQHLTPLISNARTALREALDGKATVQQESMALEGQRKLVEILTENWRVWPARKAVEQTGLGDVYCSEKGRDLMFGNHEIASDQDSAVVTKEMWSTMRQALVAPVHEPVAWMTQARNFVDLSEFTEAEAKLYGWRTVYTHQPQRTDDTKRLDALAENYWDLRCFDMPTGQGDADIGWRVIEHHMAKPHERTVAEVFRDDLRQAIDAAIEAAHGIKE